MKRTGGWWIVFSTTIVLVGLCGSPQPASGQSRGERRAESPVAAWIRVFERQPVLLHAAAVDEDFDVYFQTQLEMIRSPLILDQVLADKSIKGLSLLKQQKDPGAWLARELSVVRRGESELLVVSLKASDRGQAAKIVNAVVTAYFKANTRSREIRIRKEIESLKKEKPRTMERILDLRAELEKLVAGNDVDSDEDRVLSSEASEAKEETDRNEQIRQVVDMSRSGLKAQATALYLQLKTREARQADLLKNRPKPDKEISAEEVDEQITAHPDIQDLEYVADENFSKMEAIRTTSVRGKKHPEYERISKSYEESKKALDARRESLHQELIEQMREVRQDEFESDLQSMESEIEDLRLRLGVLTQQYLEQTHKDRSTDRSILERALLAAELTKQEKLAEAIVERVTHLQAELRAPSRLTLLRGARP